MISETITENLFRKFYGASTFIEKSAIPKQYGFISKNDTGYKGYPDFFLDDSNEDFAIVVEVKAIDHNSAENEIQFYMNNNKINKDVIGIAVSGQDLNNLFVTYYIKKNGENAIELSIKNTLVSLFNIHKIYKKEKFGDSITNSALKSLLDSLNKKFQDGNVKDTERSLFFSGLMIALSDNNFRNTYKRIQAPSREELSTTRAKVPESYNLNKAILDAITKQLSSKINNLSKEFNWTDRFVFIRSIDFSLLEYKEIIESIETKIFTPFQDEQKQDILGRAYKTFLSKAGKIDNKNIIITPDHIKSLMVKLANLNSDDVVLDTCAGTGGFLMEAMEHLIYLAKGDETKIKNIKEKQLIGFELDQVLFALTCSNMFLHGDGKTNLLYRSSLLGDTKESIINSSDEDLLNYIHSLKPTKCIINPPYESNNAFKFTKQALDYLEPNGKLIIIMPNNALTKNQGNKDKDTEKLLEISTLDFVIKMPTNLFSEQNRSVNTSIFGFTKSPHPRNKEVLFYTLENDGLVSVQHKGRLDKNNKWSAIESHILESIVNFNATQGISEKRKIYKGDDLNVAGVLNDNNNYKMIKIVDIFDVKKGSLSSENNIDGEFNFITASKEWKTHNDYTDEREAIVYAVGASGSLGRTHYVNGKFIASNLCLILTPKKNSDYPVNLEFYNTYFAVVRKQMVSDLADGGSKLSITKTIFENYYIDYIPLETQEKLLIEIKKKNESVEQLKKRAEEAENQINESILAII